MTGEAEMEAAPRQQTWLALVPTISQRCRDSRVGICTRKHYRNLTCSLSSSTSCMDGGFFAWSKFVCVKLLGPPGTKARL